MDGRLALITARRFGPFFAAQFLGAFNDNFYKNALVLLITYRFALPGGVSAQELVAVAGAIFILPFFLFSATAGALADRYDKARIGRFVKVAEIVIGLFAAVMVFRTGPVALGALLFLLFLLGVHSTFFGPVKYGILQQLVGDQKLLDANGLVSGSTFVAILLGTLAGGFAASAPGGEAWVGVGVLTVAGLGLVAARLVPSVPGNTTVPITASPFGATFRLLRSALSDRRLRQAVLASSWFWLFGSAVLSMLPPLCKARFGASPLVSTTFLVAFSVGIAVGSIAAPSFVRRFGVCATVRGAGVGLAVFGALLAYLVRGDAHEPLQLLFVGFLCLAACAGAFAVPLQTRLQQWTDESVRSRVIAAANVVNAAFMVAAGVGLGLLFRAGVDYAPIFLGLGVASAGVAFLYREYPAA